jgi:2'-5' RNA ligase
MRLFVALDLDDNIREAITRFVDRVREIEPLARWVRPESLHVTLKFIGERPETQVEEIKSALANIDAEGFEMKIASYGFFPTARAPRVFWIGIHAGPELTSLAGSIDAKLAPLGIAKEEHRYNPHLTLARGAGGSGAPRRQKSDAANRNFQRLQQELAARPAPEFGTMRAHEFFLYRSQTAAGGSKYTKLAKFSLR